MALDNLTIDIIVRHLAKQLVGSTLGRPLALNSNDFGYPYSEVLADGSIRHGTFVFSMMPTEPFLCYSFDRYTKVEDNSPFFNSLKKLSLATVTDVKKVKGERIVTISLKANLNDISEVNSAYDLILELFPNRPNCYIVAYPYGKIVSLFHERTNLEKGIFVARNTLYAYPPERETLPNSLPDLDSAKSYLNNSLFKQLKTYVETRKGTLDQAIQALASSDQLYFNGKEILPFDFANPEFKPIPPEAIYSSLVEDQKKLAKLDKEKDLIALIEKAIKVASKKTDNLNDDLKEANQHLAYKDYGQEIYLYQGEIHKGDKLLEKDGFKIPLDPLLDAPNNANRYFKKYQKAKTAIGILTDLLKKTDEETEYLKKKLQEAQDGTPRDIMELKSELLATGYIKEKQAKGRIRAVSQRRTYDPHYLDLPQGKIGFGMNGLQNEQLTFKIAKKDDLFFHVKDYPGSHVVVLEGKENENVRHTAEELALYLSHLDSGTVMIAKRKDVKKNPDKIGLVSILAYETVAVKYLRAESLALFRKALKE
ncbi:MAG: NFACT family protein [Bacilli bacterium]|jgi:predicted ribosome quality control (RQC) complex YloA/Tae2 family protein|nr:NFACT family protein [Bacilli bacterium]